MKRTPTPAANANWGCVKPSCLRTVSIASPKIFPDRESYKKFCANETQISRTGNLFIYILAIYRLLAVQLISIIKLILYVIYFFCTANKGLKANFMRQHRDLEPGFEQQLIKALVISLEDAIGADAEVHRVSENYFNDSKISAPDGLIKVHTHSKTLTIYVEAISNGYPRDIRNAVLKLNNCKNTHHVSGDIIGMVAANYLSPGAKSELKDQGIAFYEFRGSLYLKHDSWLINIEKTSKVFKKKDRTVDLFTDARENVVHALLMHDGDWLSGRELAHLSQTSEYTCSLVLQELILREWAQETGRGPSKRRKLTQPGRLLDAWAENWQGRKNQETKWYTFVENPKHFLKNLSERMTGHPVDFRWAFTGTSAANTVTPLLTGTDNAEIIVPSGYTEVMAQALSLKSAEKGANVTIIERQGASLLFRNKHPEYLAYFASQYILYLDLLNGRGRNKELAEHIRNHLELLWQRS